MAESASLAPDRSKSARKLHRPSFRRHPLVVALLAAVAMMLAACGTTPLPHGIMPSEQGNFLLSIRPADAEAVVVEEGFEARGYAGSRATDGDSGVLRYELAPGRYRVRVSKPGYEPVEKTVEIPADEETADETSLEVVLEPAPEQPPTSPDTAPDGNGTSANEWSLRGDPSFSRDELSSDQRVWYDRLLAAIERPGQDADAWAASGDLYEYGRSLNLHFSQLMLALRVTGDLRFLDEIDRLSRKMEDELADRWQDGTSDGYRNWLYLHGSSDHVGEDLHEMDDLLTHSSVAAIMYAFHVNRDLTSPAGVDYGARADFWFDYLKNDYEAKWRERNDVSEGFPFSGKHLAHPTANFMRYHYYMAKVSGDDGYLEEARRLAEVIDDNFVEISGPSGDAYVWCHSTTKCLYAQPTNYVRYTVTAVLEMALEGFGGFDGDGYLERLANSITGFVVDNGARDLAPDISGNVEREGIPIREGTDGDRDRIDLFPPLSLYARFDATGEIEDVAAQVYSDEESSPENPEGIEIPVAMIFRLAN